jgi:2-phospho-L-lactate guanylyltransferase
VATVVVPFRSDGKSRLPADVRVDLALAMLGDVLETAVTHAAHVRLVTDDEAAAAIAGALGAEVVADPGGGQGAAVQAALVGVDRACLVVNADLPCATPEALARLAAAGPAFVAASDGTTNALSLPDPTWYAPLFGPGSAARFEAAGLDPAAIPELEHDVDTLLDIEQLILPVGRRTDLVLIQHKVALARTA